MHLQLSCWHLWQLDAVSTCHGGVLMVLACCIFNVIGGDPDIDAMNYLRGQLHLAGNSWWGQGDDDDDGGGDLGGGDDGGGGSIWGDISGFFSDD